MHKQVVLEQLHEALSEDSSAQQVAKMHCDRLPQSYFDQFSLNDMLQHVRMVQRLLLPQHELCAIEWSRDEVSGQILLTVVAYDFSWLMVALTGFVSLHHFDIRQGQVFTYLDHDDPQTSDFYEKRKKVVDVLSLAYCGSPEQLENDQQGFEQDLKSYFVAMDQRKLEDFRFKLLTRVGQSFSQNKPPQSMILPMDIDASVKEGVIELVIQAKDTPFFLFSLALALTTQNIDIQGIQIATDQDNVCDRLLVHDRSGRLYQDAHYLHKFKAALALVKHFTYLLPYATDYHQAFHHFELFIDQLLQSDKPVEHILQMDNRQSLGVFAAVFGTGPYLWEQFLKIQHQTFAPLVMETVASDLRQSSVDEFHEFSQSLAKAKTFNDFVEEVNRYKDHQLFLLDMRQLIDPHYSFRDFGSDLSDLAQNIVSLVSARVYRDLVAEKGEPQCDGHACGYALLRLGKWGGHELGYASDLEMLMIYEGFGWTNRKDPLSNQEFFNLMMQRIQEAVKAKSQGVFELDLRLRPDGQKGPLATSFKRWQEYFDKEQAHPYEVQSLVKLDRICGDESLLERIMSARDQWVYRQQSLDVAPLLELRRKQVAELVKPGHINAKLSLGALVDIEYVVQMLQMRYGYAYPRVRTSRTLKAMGLLLEEGLLAPSDYERLSNAYSFFRRLINALRMVRGNAKDLEVPAVNSDEFAFLARRMRYQDQDGLSMEEQLRNDLHEHMTHVKDFVEHVFVNKQERTRERLTVSDLVVLPEDESGDIHSVLSPYGFERIVDVYKSMRRTYQSVKHQNHYLALLVMILRYIKESPDPDQIIFGFESLFAQVSKDLCRDFFYEPKVLELIVAVFGHSDFLSQILIQDESALDEVFSSHLHSDFPNQQELEREWLSQETSLVAIDVFFDRLRQFRNRIILRIGIRDFFSHADFVKVIQAVSDLADFVIDAAFRRILDEQLVPHLYEAMTIIALGKMGGQELNYSSDIDLLFVVKQDITDDDRETLLKAGQELIRRVTASSSFAQLYRVDMRLRPHGASGPLVIKENVYRTYYQTEAHGWELQAWLKARSVSGQIALGDRLINDVRSYLLEPQRREDVFASMNKMRAQKLALLEKEGVEHRDVKSGIGGIRGIEFFVQRLQVRWSSRYPDLLSGHTLYALGRLAKHGLLEEELEQSLCKDYVFLRRVEHCLQILGMRQTHLLPKDEKELLKLAKRMGYSDILDVRATDAFLRDVQSARERVMALPEELA